MLVGVRVTIERNDTAIGRDTPIDSEKGGDSERGLQIC